MRIQFLMSAVVLALASQAQASSIATDIIAQGGSVTAMSGGSASASLATSIASTGGTIVPLVSSGRLPDTPAARVDPNAPTSPFSGVVSINIRYPDPVSGAAQSFICSGSMVSATQVLSAAHCVDTDGHGHVVNLAAPGTDVRVVFNNGAGFTLATATNVVIHPQYQGFNICPDASTGCVNDDISIITIPAASVPSFVKIYKIATNVQAIGTVFTQVGYGTSGDGTNGYTVSPSFFIKRQGKNSFDLFDTDDESNFSAGSKHEVWYSDFDSSLATDSAAKRDRLCTLGYTCGTTLGNTIEDNIGGGDSGGPSFVMDAYGNYVLAGNNTFGINFDNGKFGDIFGGILLAGYYDFLYRNVIGFAVPEPESILLMGLGLVGLGLARRRRKTK